MLGEVRYQLLRCVRFMPLKRLLTEVIHIPMLLRFTGRMNLITQHCVVFFM